MGETMNEYKNVDEYIALYSPQVQEKLQALRKVIKEEAPKAEEKISWRMPTYVLYGNLVHFAGFKNHIGFYPGASGIEHFTEKFSEYHFSKGAVQFPMNKPIPFDLVREIVRFRVVENTREAEEKANKMKSK
jgi:uncharacterized protein YdhG (YjbR/CyaY superfamily)